MLVCTMRTPRLRDPRSFMDIFPVLMFTVAVVFLVLTFTDSDLIRLEMLLFFGVVIIWVLWAVNNILQHSRRY